MCKVCRQADPFAGIVGVERRTAEVRVLCIDRRLTAIDRSVEPGAELVVLSEATADVEMRTQLGVRHIARGQLRDRFVGCLLRDEIDRAAAKSAAGGSGRKS